MGNRHKLSQKESRAFFSLLIKTLPTNVWGMTDVHSGNIDFWIPLFPDTTRRVQGCFCLEKGCLGFLSSSSTTRRAQGFLSLEKCTLGFLVVLWGTNRSDLDENMAP